MFEEKAALAEEAGANALVVINNENSVFIMSGSASGSLTPQVKRRQISETTRQSHGNQNDSHGNAVKQGRRMNSQRPCPSCGKSTGLKRT